MPAAGRTPAYASFTKLRALFDRLDDQGMPAVFDRSYFGDQSGALIAMTRGSLRFLDLIDDDHRPMPKLRQLVDADEEGRKVILRELAEERYAEEIRLAKEGGTRGQLLAVMRERGLTGATAEKAITFFMHLATGVGLPVSPHFGPVRGNGSGSPTPRRRARLRRAQPLAEPVAAPVVVPAAETLDIKRSNYIDLLMKLADREEGELPPPESLDRIERALGFTEKEDQTSP